jgi:hypothetical protein
MRIKKMNWFVKLLTLNWATAICLAPFGIYIKEEYINHKVIINHEKIHWKQQMEMLLLPFYLWYLIEWIIKLFKYGKQSYNNLSFEREANFGERKPTYLDKRKPYAWIKFLSE